MPATKPRNSDEDCAIVGELWSKRSRHAPQQDLQPQRMFQLAVNHSVNTLRKETEPRMVWRSTSRSRSPILRRASSSSTRASSTHNEGVSCSRYGIGSDRGPITNVARILPSSAIVLRSMRQAETSRKLENMRQAVSSRSSIGANASPRKNTLNTPSQGANALLRKNALNTPSQGASASLRYAFERPTNAQVGNVSERQQAFSTDVGDIRKTMWADFHSPCHRGCGRDARKAENSGLKTIQFGHEKRLARNPFRTPGRCAGDDNDCLITGVVISRRNKRVAENQLNPERVFQLAMHATI